MNENDFDGLDLRRAREAAKLSRRELAERAGCSAGSVEILERGRLPKRSFVLPKILAVLDAELARKAER